MSVRRSKFEIYRELLTQVNNGNCQPTRMMYSINLSWIAFNQVKESLISQGLLAEVEGAGDRRSRTRFMVTDKGEKFLEYLGLALNSVNLEEEIQI
jgi:predicted transcriptional regulator